MFKNIMLALERIERRQRLILERLEELRAGQCPAPTEGGTDEGSQWVQKGIDNILAYQVGKKRGEQA